SSAMELRSGEKCAVTVGRLGGSRRAYSVSPVRPSLYRVRSACGGTPARTRDASYAGRRESGVGNNSIGRDRARFRACVRDDRPDPAPYCIYKGGQLSLPVVPPPHGGGDQDGPVWTR